MFKIQIPKPCHADWKEMTPTQQGAFCGSCSKEVIDFTNMNDEEVKKYFMQRSTGNTCGRFRTEQIHRIRILLPESILVQKMAGWKKYMAVVLLAFGSMLFGCDVGVDNNTTGKVIKTETPNTQLTGDTTAVDTLGFLGEAAPTMGTPAEIIKDTAISSCNILTGATVIQPNYHIQGDVAIEPDTAEVIAPKIDTTVYGGISILPVPTKKPASDTSKCNDSGYY